MDTETLEKKIKAYTKKDTVRLELLNDLILAYSKSNPNKSIEIAEEALVLAELLDDKALLAKTCHATGTSHKHIGNFDEAVRLIEKALAINRASLNDKATAANLLELGDILRNKSEYARSKEYLEESLKIFQEINDVDGIARVFNLIGNVGLAISDYSAAMEYYNKAIKQFEKIGNLLQMAGTLSNLGGVYYFTGDYPKALEQFHKALRINEKEGNKIWELANLGNIGNIYYELSDYQKALEYFEKALEISVETNSRYGIAYCNSNIGSVYAAMLENTKALEYYQKDLQISSEIGNKLEIATVNLNIGKFILNNPCMLNQLNIIIDL
ncbi:MAG: tetratricopeptide repeat protein [Ignavibacteria bacterium]|nr:tetratricopeptide repeat protein [Ignavibacteria bacterium]